MKILKENEMKQLISDEKLSEFYNENIDDNRLNELFSRYSFLKTNVNLIPLDKQSIYYSIYFWFVQFKKQYFTLIGQDEGMEQEGFKLLEEIDANLKEGIDWAIIKELEDF
ncbi:hypothetical protein [Paenibacillus sp. MMS20-IR301]|uniref:hypothetical protein n=1 Tax=Paenibacillus sp. MMS20-IR301 TaxID=2895946 RepID=UPI0028E1B3EE|nr:hypothetical protein [Paenibacillus sp. MMS20-IR301]WNS43703.1 hypothetical protein LOS79_00065 [Paenibacillus sp. MMS20-IR301]